jgi:hypothetical protein
MVVVAESIGAGFDHLAARGFSTLLDFLITLQTAIIEELRRSRSSLKRIQSTLRGAFRQAANIRCGCRLEVLHSSLQGSNRTIEMV